MHKTPISNALLLTAREAAQRLAVCEKTPCNLSTPRGPIPVVRIGRSVRYAVSDLEDFVRDQKSEGAG